MFSRNLFITPSIHKSGSFEQISVFQESASFQVLFPFFSRSSARTTPRMHSLMKATPPSHYPRFRIHPLPIDVLLAPPRRRAAVVLQCRRCCRADPLLPCRWIAMTPLMRCTVRADANKFQSDK